MTTLVIVSLFVAVATAAVVSLSDSAVRGLRAYHRLGQFKRAHPNRRPAYLTIVQPAGPSAPVLPAIRALTGPRRAPARAANCQQKLLVAA